MNVLDFLQQYIVWFFVLILIFLLIREIFTWYWKINRIVELLEQIERNTHKEGQPTITEDIKVNHVGLFGKDQPVQK